MDNKAYGLITLKSFDERTRTFKGVASTVSPDRSQDIVEPKGAEFRLPIPFLHQHDAKKPIGAITKARVTNTGIEVDGYVENLPDAPASLKERLDTAWAELKSGLVRGLSIGFNPKEYSFIKETGGIHFTKWEWLELSAVTIPSQSEASITAIKSADQRIRLAALGRTAGSSTPAGVPASQTTKGNAMKTLQEQVAELRDTLATKRARMKEIDEVVTKDGLSDDVSAEIGTLRKEIGDLDTMVAMKEGQIADAATAVAPATKSGSRGPTILVRKEDPTDKFQGQSFTRMLMAKALAHLESKDEGHSIRPSAVAEKLWGKSHPKLVSVMKANEVAGGGTGSGEWGAELVQVNTMYTGDFISYLYSKTVFDRLPLREVPARVTIKGQDGAATGFWIGESKAIKVTTGDFSNVNTTPYKVAAITQFSKELLEDSSPSVEMLMRDSLEEALRQRIDSTFLSTSNVSNGISPAGILYNLSIGASNGPDAQSARTDYRALIANFITAKNVGGLYWVTTPTLGVGLGSMVNALGQPEFPSVNVDGGTYMGYPMITGDNVGSGDFILLKPSDIWKIGDSGIRVQVSDTAMLESSSAPSGAADTPTAADQALTSMFQTDSVAIKVTRRISFGLRRSTAVAYIGDAAYGAEAS